MVGVGFGRVAGDRGCRFRCLGAQVPSRYARRERRRASPSASSPAASEPGTQSGADELSLFSPCKVNLFLRITRKREDGFHELASLFQTLAFGDAMRVEPLPSSATEDEIVCNDPSVPCDDSNLVIKAANLYRRKAGKRGYYRIVLNKRVPAGAGLGGGSGNAATMLWAANALSGSPAAESDLRDWSGDIGSDISFFFSSGSAYCTGRGEVVRAMPPALPSDAPILLLKPPQPLSTGAVYGRLDVTACSDADPETLLASFYGGGPIDQSQCVNDLETPAFAAMPSLLSAKEALLGEGIYDAVFMSGSGSTMVGLGSHDLGARVRAGREDWIVERTHPISRTEDAWFEPQRTP